MDTIEIKLKKSLVRKGFLSQNGRPTQNSLMMFFVYLKNVPCGWDMSQLHEGAIQKVREYFGTDYGFSVMIKWGISLPCSKSRTSDGRYHAMSLAYHDAKGMIGKGYVLSMVEP